MALATLLACLLAWLGSQAANAQDRPAGQRAGLTGGQTLGGAFQWSDEMVYQGWRIQRHGLLGHVRLIDPENRRQALGSYSTCFNTFQQVRGQLPPLPKHVVIVVHGLGASREFLQPMADYLQSNGHYHVVNYGYASTLKNIEESAVSFRKMLENLDTVESVDFVAHSLGNIIIRRTLYDLSQLPQSPANRIAMRRWVMISPPNHGAEAASKFQHQAMLKTFSNVLAGPVIEQLDPENGWPNIEKTLATPSFPFGIIKGGTGNPRGILEVIEGDDDGLLGPTTQELDGAQEIIQVNGIHQAMPRLKEVQGKCLNFLNTGKF